MVYIVIMQTFQTKDFTLGLHVVLRVKQTGDREVTFCILHFFSHRFLAFVRSTLLGKVLRVDIENNDDGAPYSIPLDNPFVSEKNSRPGKSCTDINIFQK